MLLKLRTKIREWFEKLQIDMVSKLYKKNVYKLKLF